MIVLSLDPSLRQYGFSVFNSKKVINAGYITTTKDDSDDHSLKVISKKLIELIDTYKPDIVYMEIPIGSKSSRAAIALNMVKGLTFGILDAKKIDYKRFLAKAIKKAMTGNENAEKEDIVLAVENKCKSSKKYLKNCNKSQKYAMADSMAVYIHTW